MQFQFEEIDIPALQDDAPFTGVEPIAGSLRSEWLILKGTGEVLLVDFDARSSASLAMLDESAFNRASEVTLRVSGDGRLPPLRIHTESLGPSLTCQQGRLPCDCNEMCITSNNRLIH